MYQLRSLPNGLRIVSERIPYFKSLSVGLWVGSSSINETEYDNGISHFIEHMIFKGTDRRSAKDIADAIDSIGGQINGFTARDCTCFYIKVMDEHINIALELLSDIILHPRFDENDIAKEKTVILEEIRMAEDSPEDLVQELMMKAFYGTHPLGLPILGTEHSITHIDKKAIVDYYNRWYCPQNAVLAIVGNYDDEYLMECIYSYFGEWHNNSAYRPIFPEHIVKPITLIKEKAIEQVHLYISVEGMKQDDNDMYALLALNNILGGGLSSRLFQKIREEKGMAYSVFSYPSFYPNSGMFSIYAAVNPSQIEYVFELISQEVLDLLKKGVTVEEYTRAKEQLKGNYVLGLESTGNRMSALGRGELVMNRVYTPEQVLEKINSISHRQVNDVVHRLFDKNIACAALVGNISYSKYIDKFTRLY